jgi:hypothetical protein
MAKCYMLATLCVVIVGSFVGRRAQAEDLRPVSCDRAVVLIATQGSDADARFAQPLPFQLPERIQGMEGRAAGGIVGVQFVTTGNQQFVCMYRPPSKSGSETYHFAFCSPDAQPGDRFEAEEFHLGLRSDTKENLDPSKRVEARLALGEILNCGHLAEAPNPIDAKQHPAARGDPFDASQLPPANPNEEHKRARLSLMPRTGEPRPSYGC